jgi:hypothetical protein
MITSLNLVKEFCRIVCSDTAKGITFVQGDFLSTNCPKLIEPLPWFGEILEHSDGLVGGYQLIGDESPHCDLFCNEEEFNTILSTGHNYADGLLIDCVSVSNTISEFSDDLIKSGTISICIYMPNVNDRLINCRQLCLDWTFVKEQNVISLTIDSAMKFNELFDFCVRLNNLLDKGSCRSSASMENCEPNDMHHAYAL